MRIILALIIISVGSLFGSVVLNKRYEEMLPFSIFSIIISLYLFYILNLLKYGYYFILFSALILTIFSIYKFFKKKEIRKQAIANFFTPGLLIFAVAVIIIYFITKNNYVMLFDELRLWGAYPKALYSFEELLLGNNEFFSSTYFPGMPLFQYFFAKTVGYFAESHLFLSYGIVGLSMLLPFTKKITWKKYWLIIPTIIFTITLPMLFANSGFDCLYYYKTLFIDPMMGIAFGYALYLSTKDFRKDKFSYILFCLLIVMPLLFKLIGLTLVCVVAFSYLVHQLFIYKTINLKIKKDLFKSIIKLLIPFLVVIFVFFSWQLAASTQKLKEGSAIATPSKEAINVIINPTKDDKEFFNKYTTYIKDSKILVADNVLSKYYTVPNISIFIMIILIGLIISTKKESRKSIMVSIISSALAIIGSLLFLYVTYSVVFHHTILCYERYISPVFSGLSIFLIYIIVNIDIKESKKSLYYLLISLLIMLFLLNFPKVTTFEYRSEVEKASNNFARKVVTLIPEGDKPVKLLTIYKKCDIIDYSCVLWQHQLYLELLDDDVLATGLFIADEDEAKNFLVGQSDAPAAFDIITSYYDNFSLKGYDYALIVENVENVNEKVKKYFGGKMNAGDLYKVIENKSGTITLKKVSN